MSSEEYLGNSLAIGVTHINYTFVGGNALEHVVVANAVAGGVWMLGDDLPALSADRLSLALSEPLIDMRGMNGHPRNPLSFVSGIDPGPPFEGVNPNDQVPTIWDFDDGSVALLNMSSTPMEIEGPGGVELLSGLRAEPGVRVLEPGAGEVWVP